MLCTAHCLFLVKELLPQAAAAALAPKSLFVFSAAAAAVSGWPAGRRLCRTAGVAARMKHAVADE